MEIPLKEVKELLERLEFTCELKKDHVLVTAPPIRMDIGEGLTGVADVMEEIARIYGYDRIPETRMADPLPPQRGNPSLNARSKCATSWSRSDCNEIITHRMTRAEIENRLLPKGTESHLEYVRLVNPIAPEYAVMRRSVLSSVLEVVEHNARLRETLAFFEIGQVFIPSGRANCRSSRGVWLLPSPADAMSRRGIPSWASSWISMT